MSGVAEEAIALLRKQSAGLSQKKLLDLPVDEFIDSFHAAMGTGAVAAPGTPPADGPSGPSPDAPGVGHEPADVVSAPVAPTGAVAAVAAQTPTAPEQHEAAAPVDHTPAASAGKDGRDSKEHGKEVAGDQTIRVEVGRLESLLNLVGELVLQKNRVSALSRQLAVHDSTPQDMRESFTQAYGSLDRVTSDLQAAVMKTRMQPLDKIFGKYPRIIRDLARKLGKQINLVIEGGETEVDKSVIEELGDPLVHLIRNSCDHGVELPDVRTKAGKPELGTVRLRACHRGSHVQILISDDGKGLGKEKIVEKAIEKGLYTAEQLAQMTEKDIYRIIFAAGFSTADKISDVSGRGVGMDVVRTNIEKLKGTIELYSEPGKGTTVEILIPLTVAIMSAMMVGVGDEIYAVPLSNIVEIVRPEAEQLASITQRPVLRLRDRVLPLLSAAELFSVPPEKAGKAPFAVVLELSDKTVGLLVDRLIGQQEIVIKPLNEMLDKGGPVSGATVRDDGGVSLIVDIARLFQIAEQRTGRG
jgi:two-component system chemotaxis sensor kinase CheA